eukprot:GHVR01021765.1.p1 GENE.GHVR01021765.1~~GHVR01021765.1.p1  ORF type:complete len:131 (-),score=14.75 GHVR01021765.1:213-605(-)
MSRRPITPKRARTIIFHQAARVGAPIVCPLCKGPIRPDESVTMEHLVPLALGGADDDGEDNCAYAHTPCSLKKTQGTASTGHRGDTANIARAKRLEKGGKARGPGPKSRKFQKHPTLVRGLDGKVKERTQ